MSECLENIWEGIHKGLPENSLRQKAIRKKSTEGPLGPLGQLRVKYMVKYNSLLNSRKRVHIIRTVRRHTSWNTVAFLLTKCYWLHRAAKLATQLTWSEPLRGLLNLGRSTAAGISGDHGHWPFETGSE